MRERHANVLLLALIILVVAAPAHARKRQILPGWEWGLSVAAGGTYDDNVLGFSERDQNTFLRDQGSFPTPLESVDDIESQVQVRPSLQWRAPMNLMFNGDYRLKWVHRIRNTFADYQTHTFGVSLRPRVSGYRWTARARVLAIPSYYLRVYRDRDYDEKHAARYANLDYLATFRYNAWNGLWVIANAGYGTDYYNRKFTEYDTEYWDFSLGASYEFPSDVKLLGTYTRRLSNNVGSDQITVVPRGYPEINPMEDTEYGDASYHEDDWNANITTVLPWIKSVETEGSLDFRYRRRIYTTDRSLESDPIHRGRMDHRSQWGASILFKPSRLWNVEASFLYEARRTGSDWPTVPLAKNFIRREIGLLFTYKIR